MCLAINFYYSPSSLFPLDWLCIFLPPEVCVELKKMQNGLEVAAASELNNELCFGHNQVTVGGRAVQSM